MSGKYKIGIGVLAVLSAVVGGCDKLGIGHSSSVQDEAPTPQQLQKIGYMSSADSGPEGRKLYTRPEEAKTCGDFELAMRWNRPPGVEGGPFHQKMVYLDGTLPADLPRNSEVILSATIQEGQTLTSGSQRWYLRMKDGTLVEAIEDSGFMEKQERAAQEQGAQGGAQGAQGGAQGAQRAKQTAKPPARQTALVEPNKPRRAFCGHGVYQGVAGKDPAKDEKIPLFSVLFAMDRKK
jgi:hypothetical protein